MPTKGWVMPHMMFWIAVASEKSALVIWVSCRIEGWKSPKLCRIPIDRLNMTDAPIRIDHFW